MKTKACNSKYTRRYVRVYFRSWATCFLFRPFLFLVEWQSTPALLPPSRFFFFLRCKNDASPGGPLQPTKVAKQTASMLRAKLIQTTPAHTNTETGHNTQYILPARESLYTHNTYKIIRGSCYTPTTRAKTEHTHTRRFSLLSRWKLTYRLVILWSFVVAVKACCFRGLSLSHTHNTHEHTHYRRETGMIDWMYLILPRRGATHTIEYPPHVTTRRTLAFTHMKHEHQTCTKNE